jgi:hypothetical protein
MSLPVDDAEQVRRAVTWKIKFFSNAALGVLVSLVALIGRIMGHLDEDLMFSCVRDAFSVVGVAAAIYSHYPVNWHLLIFYLLASAIFAELLHMSPNATVGQLVDHVTVHFYGGKWLLDLIAWATDSNLV